MRLRLPESGLALFLVACSGPSDPSAPPTGGADAEIADGASDAAAAADDAADASVATDANDGDVATADDRDATDARDADDRDVTDASDAGDVHTVAFHEDFESYATSIANKQAIGPWVATVSGTGTAMAVDGVKPFGGAKALHVTVPAGTAARGTLHQVAVAAGGALIAGNDLFGRVMVFYSNVDGNDLPIGVHSWLFDASGKTAALDGGLTNIAINMGGGGAKMQLNYSVNDHSVQGGVMTAGAWHCIQWEYDGAGTPPADKANVWVDGVKAIGVTPAAQGWTFATPWSSFDVGFTHYQTLAKGVDVYLDDFALDDRMVTCP